MMTIEFYRLVHKNSFLVYVKVHFWHFFGQQIVIFLVAYLSRSWKKNSKKNEIRKKWRVTLYNVEFQICDKIPIEPLEEEKCDSSLK